MEYNRDENMAFFEKLQSTKNSRNLSDVFEEDNKPLQTESKNLRYQPQSSHKAPEPSQQELQNKQAQEQKRKISMQRFAKRDLMHGSWSTIMAVVAEAYKGKDNMGRVGLALLRNDSGAAQLMIYKTKAHILSWLLLTKSKSSPAPRVGRCTVIKREAYFQFFDEEASFWSIHIVLKQDEEDFIQELNKLGLDLNGKTPESTYVRPASSTASSTVSSTASAAQDLADNASAEPVKSNNEDSENESTLSGEDVISTSRDRKPSTSIEPCSTVSVARAGNGPQETICKFETYLEEQRAAGQSIEKKMDLILQALCCLATKSSTTLSSLKDGGDVTIESLIQANMNLLHKCNDNPETSTLRTKLSGNEQDELLEMEQKVLDYKKENRALLKSLRAKEQAIDVLRNSTGSLCNELVTQNNDLKAQNTTLIAAMAAMNQEHDCGDCGNYIERITSLERHIALLQEQLVTIRKREAEAAAEAASAMPN